MDEVRIFEVTEVRSEYADAVGRLLPQLSSTPHIFTVETLQRLVDCETTHLFLLEEGGAVRGMLTLCAAYSPTGCKMWIEDVVVDSDCRGRSFGRKLVEYAIDYAGDCGNVTLMLTSRPSRVAANALYRSAGFSQKETNVYAMKK